MDEDQEEQYEKWNEWAVYLSNYAVVNLNEKAEEIYIDYKTKNILPNTKKYKKFLDENKESKNLKSDLYHYFLQDDNSYVECLSHFNRWTATERLEFFEFYCDHYIDEDNKDTGLNKAVVKMCLTIKREHGII